MLWKIGGNQSLHESDEIKMHPPRKHTVNSPDDFQRRHLRLSLPFHACRPRHAPPVQKRALGDAAVTLEHGRLLHSAHDEGLASSSAMLASRHILHRGNLLSPCLCLFWRSHRLHTPLLRMCNLNICSSTKVLAHSLVHLAQLDSQLEKSESIVWCLNLKSGWWSLVRKWFHLAVAFYFHRRFEKKTLVEKKRRARDKNRQWLARLSKPPV